MSNTRHKMQNSLPHTGSLSQMTNSNLGNVSGAHRRLQSVTRYSFCKFNSHNRPHYLNYTERSLRATSTFLGSVPSSNIYRQPKKMEGKQIKIKTRTKLFSTGK